MQIKFDVFSRRKGKKRNLGYLIEDHVTVTEDDIKDLVLKVWLSDHEFGLREDRNYEIDIDKIIID